MARRRVVLVVAALLFAWGIVLLATGGVVVETPWGRLSSRAAVRPFIGCGLVLLFYFTRWRRCWHTDIAALDRIPLEPALAGLAVVLSLAIGLIWGTRIAGGPDASAYVSHAALLARGELTTTAPVWARDAPWAEAVSTAAPSGYAEGARPGRLAPTVSPGLPLLMALAQMIAGGGAVFYVVPFLGAVLVWATWRLGRDIGGGWTGAAAAWLVAISPAFLVMLVQPMSDVPAAAFWALSLLAAWRGHPLASGLAAAMAVLIRPNIVPLALVPALLVVAHQRGGRLTRVATFVAAVFPACLVIAALNAFYRGSPLQSGYGSLGELYSLSRVGSNLERYASWFFASQTPVPLLGLLAPAVLNGSGRGRILLVTTMFPIALVAFYLPYFVFGIDDWPYLRFLLPAYPPLMIGLAIVAGAAAHRIRVAWARAAAVVTIVAAVAVHGWKFAAAGGVFAISDADTRYVRTAEYVKRLPPRSIAVSRLHSGPIHFYTGRDVLQFERLSPHQVETAVFHLRDAGYQLYLVGDGLEVEMFRRMTNGTRTGMWLDRALGIDVGGAFVYPLDDGYRDGPR